MMMLTMNRVLAAVVTVCPMALAGCLDTADAPATDDGASTVQTVIYTGSVIPGAFGFYQKVFNTSNGNAGLFPGLFQFCLRNSSLNPGPFFSDASVVTF
jgi:hypothetical protein